MILALSPSKQDFDMQVTNQIDQLIQKLNTLKPSLANGSDTNVEQFNMILKETLESSTVKHASSKEITAPADQKKVSMIPDWVDPNYGYDPQNPRKPNMSEFMKAVSGKNLESLDSDPSASRNSISQHASQLLYGVVGSNEDTRDWSTIMAAEDILAAAKIETGRMYEPKIDIKSIFDDDGELSEQIAVLKDKNDTTLRVLPSEVPLAEETLRNFGATYASVPTNIENKVISNKFDSNFLTFLKNFDRNPQELEQLALRTTAADISNLLSDDISLNEYK